MALLLTVRRGAGKPVIMTLSQKEEADLPGK
jgi:hypothetical protein